MSYADFIPTAYREWRCDACTMVKTVEEGGGRPLDWYHRIGDDPPLSERDYCSARCVARSAGLIP
jgi:hypothetical protein